MQYIVIQCLDCMFYECKWDNGDNVPHCIDCGSMDVAVVRCRPHNWERGVSRKKPDEVKNQVPFKY